MGSKLADGLPPKRVRRTAMSPETIRDRQARLCRSMGYPVRVELMDALRDSPKCVRELSALLGRQESTVSRHLSILRSAGVVAVEHRGQNAYYRVADPRLLKICDLMRETLAAQRRHEGKLAREL